MAYQNNRDYPAALRPGAAAGRDERERRDSSSTFFGGGGGNGSGRERSSTDLLRSPDPMLSPPPTGTPGTPGAGYNRASYYVQPEREEPVRWGGDEEKAYAAAAYPLGSYAAHGKSESEDEPDVYADFNNAGKRIVPLGDAGIGRPAGAAPARAQYSRASSFAPTSALLPGTADGGPMEYVTVPTLGPDWRADELREMTRKGRREAKLMERTRKWRAWLRDEEGIFGKWGRRKSLVWGAFALCCVAGILLAILIPRVPDIQLYGTSPLSAPSNPATDPSFSRTPANFTFDATLALQVDTSSQVALPLRMNSMWATIWDEDTNVAVGTGQLGGFSAPAKQYTAVQMPLVFEYAAVNASDATWSAFRNACGYIWTGTTRPGLNLRFQIFMQIAGLPGQFQSAVSLSSVPCPIQLPQNAP